LNVLGSGVGTIRVGPEVERCVMGTCSGVGVPCPERRGHGGPPIAGPLTAAKFRLRALGDARRIGKSVSPPTQLPAFVQLASNPTWAPRAP
jgi:hypothetical protein